MTQNDIVDRRLLIVSGCWHRFLTSEILPANSARQGKTKVATSFDDL